MESREKNLLTKLGDVFMFREGGEDDNYNEKPTVTTGSIIWGILLRSIIIIIASILVIGYSGRYEWGWVSIFAMWFLVAYPAYRQFQKFNKRTEEILEDTLCGSCKHYEQTGQLCSLYDEHVTKQHLPCEGMDWEPRQNHNY